MYVLIIYSIYIYRIIYGFHYRSTGVLATQQPLSNFDDQWQWM